MDDNRREMDEKPMVRCSPAQQLVPVFDGMSCGSQQEDAMEDKGGGDDGDAKRSMRPTTARRRPPKVKDATREVAAKDVAPSAKKTEGIMRDGEEVEVSECDTPNNFLIAK